MKAVWWIALALALLPGLGCRAADAVDERKPYGRVCLAEVSASGVETLLDPATPPVAGGKLLVHMDANAECAVLVVAFDPKSGQLANSWRPQWIEMSAWDEKSVPKEPAVWSLAGASLFDCYVLFMARNANDSQGIKRLVDLIQSARDGGPLLALQTDKLREMVTSQLAKGDPASHAASVFAHDEIGGAFRGSTLDFPWRKFSTRVNFAAERPGLLIFPGVGKTETGK